KLFTFRRTSPISSPVSPSFRFAESQPTSEPLRTVEKSPSKSYATLAFIFPKNVAAASVRRADAGYSHDDRIRDTLRKVQRTQFLERVALIYACVQTGNMAPAEMLYHRLLLSNPEDMKEIMDVRSSTRLLSHIWSLKMERQNIRRRRSGLGGSSSTA
ncbi:hypothetical protein BJ742DRAFT_793252, partial [Cladochytrium replicatum]